MNSVNSSLKNFSHSVGQNWYHVVLIPKNRYPLFAQEHQRQLAIKAFEWICSRHKIEIFTQEIMDDHVHLFISCPPDYSIRKLVQLIKGGSSYYIRKNHPPLKQYKALWSKGFMYRSVGSVSAEVVRHYIDNSNNWFTSRQQKKLL
jgi:putative transposase